MGYLVTKSVKHPTLIPAQVMISGSWKRLCTQHGTYLKFSPSPSPITCRMSRRSTQHVVFPSFIWPQSPLSVLKAFRGNIFLYNSLYVLLYRSRNRKLWAINILNMFKIATGLIARCIKHLTNIQPAVAVAGFPYVPLHAEGGSCNLDII